MFFLAESVPESWPDTPKSASLTSPVAERRILAAEEKGNNEKSCDVIAGETCLCLYL